MSVNRITRHHVALAGLLLIAPELLAQHEHHSRPLLLDPASATSTTDAHAHHGPSSLAAPHEGSLNRAASYLFGFSSGTSRNPSAWPMPMAMTRTGNWSLMWMGQAFLVSTQQSRPRGGDKVYSANWGMLGAARSLGRGSIMFRGMVSLDPVTIPGKQYPLLFQTGELAYGKAIVDGQHPHDLLMELSIQYARPVNEKAMVSLYYAPVGDAALGPVAFPHRASAMELPQATLGHHWQDATHIANNVFTAGMDYGKIRMEASGFRGREPNENRWNIDMGGMDSWSVRLSWRPASRWLAQISTSRLRQPETTHRDDVERTTASVHYTSPLRGTLGWSTSVIWARNYKTIGRYATNALLAETVRPITRRNLLTGRFEWSQRDELFEDDHQLGHEIFEKTGSRAHNVSALTVGYTRELGSVRALSVASGFNVSAYSIASALKPFYGSTPAGVNVFLRFRLNAAVE